MADLDRLLREQNPEPGQPRIPVPQYQKVGGLGYEKVTGQHGGAHAVLLGPNGQPISSGNRLAVDTGLNNNLQIIADKQGQLYGSPDGGLTWKAVKVNAGGQLELAQTVVIDNVTVNVGAEVAVYNRNDEPLKVQQSGSLVQQPDVIAADTVIAAGADIILSMRTIASKRIAVGIRLGAARKHQVAMLCYAASDATNYIKEAIVVDNASDARTLDAAQMDAFTNRLKLRVYNKDTQDMTVKLLSLAEVH